MKALSLTGKGAGLLEDKELIQLLQNKPSDGLREAINQYGELLKVVIARILPQRPMDVEECVADTFVNAWKTINRLDAETANLKGYLLCIAKNTAINRYHRIKKHSSTSLDTLEIPADTDVEQMLLSAETSMELQEVIAEMPNPNQEIILRKYFLFETTKEIAQHLSMDECQIKNRLYRSRQYLKRVLEERGFTDAKI